MSKLRNLALNKPIVTNQSTYENYKIQYANDGVLDEKHSYWSNTNFYTGKANYLEITIDLLKVYKICKLGLFPFKNRCKIFELQYSNDNIKWNKAMNGVLNNTNTLQLFNFNPIIARYFRFIIKESYLGDGWAFGIGEIQLLGQSIKYLIKHSNNYYSSKSSFHELGQPKDNNEKERFYKENGIDDLNALIEKKNSKSVNLKLDKNYIYKTDITIDFNEVTDKIEYIDEDNKKEIKCNTEEYQLLDFIKKEIGNKFQIVKWEEK